MTGGDSGIGKAVALLYVLEGADVAINYLPEEQSDAEATQKQIEQNNGKCYLIPHDIRGMQNCKKIVDTAVEKLGGLDILVNNAAWQTECDDITKLTE